MAKYKLRVNYFISYNEINKLKEWYNFKKIITHDDMDKIVFKLLNIDDII